jgi:hypothetical protein
MPKPPSLNKPKCNSPAYSKFQQRRHLNFSRLWRLATHFQSPEAAGRPAMPIDSLIRKSEPKTRRVITKEISKVRKRRKEGKEEQKGKRERIVILTVLCYLEDREEKRL